MKLSRRIVRKIYHKPRAGGFGPFCIRFMNDEGFYYSGLDGGAALDGETALGFDRSTARVSQVASWALWPDFGCNFDVLQLSAVALQCTVHY